MKVCPKCGEIYDDSWGVCLYCTVPLADYDNVEKRRSWFWGRRKVKRPKQKESLGYWQHFGGFLGAIFLLAIILWLIGAIIPLIIPFAILITIFSIFIYPVMKIKDKMRRRNN